MGFWSHLFSQKLPPLLKGRELVLQHLQLLDEAVLLRHLVLVDVQSLQGETWTSGQSPGPLGWPSSEQVYLMN